MVLLSYLVRETVLSWYVINTSANLISGPQRVPNSTAGDRVAVATSIPGQTPLPELSIGPALVENFTVMVVTPVCPINWCSRGSAVLTRGEKSVQGEEESRPHMPKTTEIDGVRLVAWSLWDE